MEIAQRALWAQVPGEVLQEQSVLRFAMGCNDTRVGRKLIESTPSTVDEAVHRVKTIKSLTHVAGKYAWCPLAGSHKDWVVPLAVRLFHLTREYLPLGKVSAIGGLVVALSATGRDILGGNV